MEQQADEDEAAQDAHDKLDGQLIGVDDHPADHVAGEHEKGAEEGGVHQGAPDLVPLEHGHHVGDDEADVGDGAHHHNDGRRDHGGDGETQEENYIVGHAQVFGKIPAHAHDVEVVGEEEGQHHQRHRQPHELVPALEDQGEVAHQPGGEGLGHFVLIGQIAGDAADDVAEHDAHQGDHHCVLELDALDEADEEPGAQNGEDEGEKSPAPQGGLGQEEQSQQDAELGRGEGGAGGGGDELVAAQLLHDETGDAHAHAGAQDGQKPGQTGDEQDLQGLQVSGEKGARGQIDDAHEEGAHRQQEQCQRQDQSGTGQTDHSTSFCSAG